MDNLKLNTISRRLSPPMKDVLAMMYAVKDVYQITESTKAVEQVRILIESGEFSLGSLLSFTVVTHNSDDLAYIKHLFDIFDSKTINIILKEPLWELNDNESEK